MNETLTNFRQAVADNADLQEKVKAGADLVALGKESGFEFTQEELETGWEELQESDEGLTDFELDVWAFWVYGCAHFFFTPATPSHLTSAFVAGNAFAS